MKKLSSWKFDEEVSNIFDEYVRQSVPLYDYMQIVICNLSDFFIQDKGFIYDLGCSTGETIHKINLRHSNKNIQFIGIDESESMITKAIEKNKFNENVVFEKNTIEDYKFETKSNLILSVLSMQFLSIEKRELVLNKIYEALNKGGAFVFVEKVYASNSQVQDIFTQTYHDYKEEQGLNSKEIRDKDKSLRGVLIPLSESENIEMLKKLGFKTEVFFKYLNFTGFIAIK